jgi:hypothetical protein
MMVPEAIRDLIQDLESADAFELDRRLRVAVRMEQQLNARIGPLLEVVLRLGIHRMLGYATRDAYVRERLGREPTWGRELRRVERAAWRSPAFARAYRSGELTANQATALVPLVATDMAERWVEAWVARAGEFTLRRLKDDVEQALLVYETDYQRWLRTGGLPEDEDESGEGIPSGDEQRMSAKHTEPRETRAVQLILNAEVARLFRAVVCSVRRRMERSEGRLPTEGEALEAMLEHVLTAWGDQNEKVRKEHAIFARDGWRCVRSLAVYASGDRLVTARTG